ncbi:MAG: hypothetical protein KME08_03620 [Aphanothece sp. CMT-3BRIN-NPC111]|nr:hypothetical protein [Aphanothece sp. CMT-3BRIN-NPC111]
MFPKSLQQVVTILSVSVPLFTLTPFAENAVAQSNSHYVNVDSELSCVDQPIDEELYGRNIYQLFLDGVRVRYELDWTREQAIANLELNKKNYPQKKVEGLFNGKKVGYELFWNKVRVGFEPSWTREQAVANLEFNKKSYPQKKVEGVFNGKKVGYELFWDDARVGFEPSWTREQAIDNLNLNHESYPQKKVDGCFNGEKLYLPSKAVTRPAMPSNE